MEQSPSWEANSLQIVKKFPSFYRTRRFTTGVTSARHLPLSWASSNLSVPPHPNSSRSILILSSHIRLGLQSGVFPSGFPTKTLYKPLLPHTRYTPRPSHFSGFDHPNNSGEEYRSLSSSLCSFLRSRVTSSLLGPNTLLSTLFSHPQPAFLPQFEQPCFTSIQNHR